MTKSKFNKKKLIPFLAILTLVFLGVFNLNSVYAIHMEGDGATFYPDDEHPIQYGVFIPTPNMYATMSIGGSNQGQFTIMDWRNSFPPIAQEMVSYPGENISLVYPWYFEGYLKDSTSFNDYLDPWDIEWLNVTAFNPHNVTLSPFTLNTVFNYHVMIEGTSPIFPLNHSIPLQIDLVIKNPGPKILKFDWLTTNPPVIWDYRLISPSEEYVLSYPETARYNTLLSTEEIFDYIVFVAKKAGTYRLLVDAEHTHPAYLNLEFLKSSISNLPFEKLKFIGNSDKDPSLIEQTEIEWQSNWLKISGKKGELYRIDIGEDYVGTPPTFGIWMPSEYGYLGAAGILPTSGVFYFPEDGNGYFSFIDADYGDWYRYSLYLKKLNVLDYNIGDNLTTLRVSRDQEKAIGFTIEQDSFVRFNFTSYSQPAGNPWIGFDLFFQNEFLFKDSKSMVGFESNYPIEEKQVGSETFYYYYFPAGTYTSVIQNENISYDGVFQISSKYVDFSNETIPISSLSYPDTDPSQFLTLEFDPDEYYNGIYDAQYAYINITQPGQYILNTTIYASDYLASLPLTANPAAVVVFNSSVFPSGSYHDWTEEALDPLKSFPAFSDDTVGEQSNDILFIAYPQKWHNMEFNFSQLGTRENPALDLNYYTYDGNDFTSEVSETLDTTTEFTSNGKIVLELMDTEYLTWIPGADFDLPTIEEDDYYWLAISLEPGWDYSQLPYIQILKLSNITLQGDLNFALVRESSYQYADYWQPDMEVGPTLLINQYQNATEATRFLETGQPYIIGFEEGVYKLLIIPHGWSGSEPLKVNFAVENFWPYRHQAFYNITDEPNLYLHQINNYTAAGYGQINDTIYSYGLTTTYNSTESELIELANENYFVIECVGSAYQWTQLVIACNNVSSYRAYLMQDLPWVTNDPNYEIREIEFASYPFINNTYEFGVHTDHFYILFEVDGFGSPDEMVTFRIDLNQYNTTMLTTSVPIASYTPPMDTGLILGLAIGIPVAAGIIVVIYVLKKKGRILSKTP